MCKDTVVNYVKKSEKLTGIYKQEISYVKCCDGIYNDRISSQVKYFSLYVDGSILYDITYPDTTTHNLVKYSKYATEEGQWGRYKILYDTLLIAQCIYRPSYFPLQKSKWSTVEFTYKINVNNTLQLLTERVILSQEKHWRIVWDYNNNQQTVIANKNTRYLIPSQKYNWLKDATWLNCK